MSRYVITDVYCGVCKKSITGSDHWVYRGGLKLLCPDCGLTYKWPYALYTKEKCVDCGKHPDFVLGNDPNRPILYCRECMLLKAITELGEVANQRVPSLKPPKPNTYKWWGALSITLALLMLGIVLSPMPQSGVEWGYCLTAFFLVTGVLMIVFNKKLVQSDLESKKAHLEAIDRERIAAREVLSRLSKGRMSVEQKLAVFGLVPGNPFRANYISYALQQVQPVSAQPGQCQFCGKSLLTEKGVVITSPDGVSQAAQQMLARRCDCVNCGAVFCLECGNAEGHKKGTGSTHCPKCGTTVPIERLI